jgi:hypothetical protein
MGNQTAVEWLQSQIAYDNGYGKIVNAFTEAKDLRELFDQAKAIEKQQIVEAWVDGGRMISIVDAKNGEQYFESTYKTKEG